MQAIKKTVISLAMAISMTAISSVAFAEPDGEAKVRAAAETTVAKIEEAVSMAEKGASKEEMVKIINEARQIQKEFRYEITERQRQKSNDKLRIARDAFDDGDKATASAKLSEALAGYKEMKAIYDSNHK
ncbi:hypothetical protein JCM14076_08080 [Methylosoma difficile]